jgi:hypothetical protein
MPNVCEVVIMICTVFGPVAWVYSAVSKIIENAVQDPLSAIAIVLGVVGIWRAEVLFTKLDRNLENLIKNMKDRMLDEAITVTSSYAGFIRAMQKVELHPNELPKDAAFALFTTFHLQTLRYPGAKPEQMAQLRKDSRANVDTYAQGYVDMLLQSGLASTKDSI